MNPEALFEVDVRAVAPERLSAFVGADRAAAASPPRPRGLGSDSTAAGSST